MSGAREATAYEAYAGAVKLHAVSLLDPLPKARERAGKVYRTRCGLMVAGERVYRTQFRPEMSPSVCQKCAALLAGRS